MILTTISSLNGHLSWLYSADPNFRDSWIRASGVGKPVTQEARARRILQIEAGFELRNVSDCTRRQASSWQPSPPACPTVLSRATAAAGVASARFGLGTPARVMRSGNRGVRAGRPRGERGALLLLLRRGKPKTSIAREVREYATGVSDLDLWDLSPAGVVEDVRAVFGPAKRSRRPSNRRGPLPRFLPEPKGRVAGPVSGRPHGAPIGERGSRRIRRGAGCYHGPRRHRDCWITRSCRCRTVEPSAAGHEAWLRGLSQATNIIDVPPRTNRQTQRPAQCRDR